MPAAIPILIGATVAGTAISTAGQIKAGNAAKDLGDFNAQVADAQAADALARGRQDEQTFRQGVRGLIGSQRAGFAGQGVDVGSGSALDVQGDAAYLGELDAQQIRLNAARAAWGYSTEAKNARMGGQNAQDASRWGAASTILGGAAGATSLIAQRYGFGGGGKSYIGSSVNTTARSAYGN